VAPSADHERCARLVDRLMAVLALEYGVDIEFFGSTTFKTPAGGGEPDACFYIASAGAVLGKRALDLAIDPPPDIVCEIDLTRERIDKRGLYASFGVPEFWRFDGESMCAYALRRAEYVEVEHSVAFPWLAIAEVERFLKMRETSGQTEIIRAWRAWLLARR
jgi:Uma2 family endonuclease